ncbi:ABC transporter permease [Fulvivirgaceae bacterium BMA10]|uniref:ABC transporter permease n=1 Tax=Splendidivirga corallicola TaxID=3051826 RepID=A0ABT8L0Z4_9BACT|nr:ABC transporter permease [Fulvivirgaceae bacterium BMA10]
MREKINIPKIPHAFFKWYCQQEKYEELHGDLEEFYYERVTELGAAKARLCYLIDVIRCCQPYAWKKTKGQTNSNIMMFKNYYKTSSRSLMKSPLSSFINVFGLSVAIGICLVVYTFLAWDHSIDRFHEYKNEVYLATFFADRDGTEQQYGMTPTPLGEMLREDFTHIKKVCRLEDRNVVLKYEDKVFHEQVRYSDPEFLEMFTFPLKWGSPGSLSDANSIILSEEMSIKYFGEENPVGQDMLMIFGKDNNKLFKVTGVAEAFPKAHAIDFDFLINFENFKISDPTYDLNDWSGFVNATLIQVDNPSDLADITGGMEKYRILQNEVQEDWAISSFTFERLADLHEKSGNIEGDISYDDNLEARIGMPVIALFMLVLACLNYINIAIVSAAKRLKEIGLRKVIGAHRRQVIVQFLAENILITFFALILGCILAVTIFIPWLAQLAGWEMELQLIDKNLWIFLVAILLITGIASGIYPAFYISKFDAVKIFKGSVKFGKKNPLTKVFLGTQLILACITITAGVVFTQNNTYQSTRSWGYQQKGAIYVHMPDTTAFEQLQATMIQNPNVVAISGSAHHLGKDMASVVVHVPGRQYEVNELIVDPGYFETMGLQLIDGRVFQDHPESDKQAIIVNEQFVKKLALNEPIGQLFEIDSAKYEVIGVIKDFHFYSFFNKIEPTIFRVANPGQYHYLSLRVNDGSEKETYQALQDQWASLFPEIPFQGGYQEDVWGEYFHMTNTAERFNKVIAFVAVLLASLGLYGLVTLNVSGRTREFSIRKTLGAGIRNITSNIVRQYMILAAVALLIGAPISYVFIEAYLDMLFVYHIPMSYSSVAISVVILTLVLLAVISTQIRKVSKSNPVDGLKAE